MYLCLPTCRSFTVIHCYDFKHSQQTFALNKKESMEYYKYILFLFLDYIRVGIWSSAQHSVSAFQHQGFEQLIKMLLLDGTAHCAFALL